MKFPKLNMGGGLKAPGIKIGGAPKLGGASDVPHAPATGNVRPHLAGVSSHRLSLRGRSAFPPNPATAFNSPGTGAGPDPEAAFAGGAGPSGAAQGDMGQ